MNVAQSNESPGQLWSNYYKNSRLSNGFLSNTDSEGLLGIGAAVTMTSTAAGTSGLVTISGAFTMGSVAISGTLAASTFDAYRNDPNKTLGDKAKLGFNILLTIGSAIPETSVPAAILSILDYNGFFEPFYTQLDIYDVEGQWVYYNMYTNTMNSKKIK